MAKHGKKYRERVKLVDKTVQHSVEDSVKLLRQLAYANFDETINLDIRLGVDPRNADQQVRGTVALPHGTGKTVRVAVFAKGEQAQEAEAAGADVVGGEDLVKRIQGGFMDFDKAIATPEMMRFVGRIGKMLGPRGMMPNPKAGTVTMDVKSAVEALKAGQVEYRVDRFAIVHTRVGLASFSDEQLIENIRTLMTAIWKAKPAASKGKYVKSVSLSSTMSPGVRIRNEEGAE